MARRGVRDTFARLDPGLLVAAAGLTVMGVVLAYSATRHTYGSAILTRGAINAVVGMCLGFAVLRVDYRSLRAWAPAVYGVAVLLLVAVLSPLGSTINGSKSWIELPGFSIQPAELAKVALVVIVASVLAGTGEKGPDGAEPPWRDVRLALLLVIVVLGLIMVQPDLGSGLVVASLAFAMFAIAGLARKWIAVTLALGIAAATLALTTPILAQYQRNRLLAFINPQGDPSGIGYQVQQVKIAIGSGGLFGQGLFEGRSTQGGFIPFQYTDFVFSVAGEELGFIGAFGIVLLQAFIVWRSVNIGRKSKDDFGRLVCAGVAGWFLFQSLENIGMNIGIMPVTGVPLPLVSYGGSSVFACWVAIGLVGNVHMANARRLS